ncbi:hypothetical protein FSP39_009671, partial [Pinctada imbricata]
NKQYLEYLLKKYDVIGIQEHWLFSIEKNTLIDFANENDCNILIKCCEDDDPIGPKYKPRGKGGVALIWKKMLDGVKARNDGGNRIGVITIDEAICLVNVYLTS